MNALEKLCVAALALTLGLCALGPAARAQSNPAFPPDRIEQLVAPVALYPDALLSQVLMASTYPLEIVEADRWVKADAGLQGKALDEALAKQSWDPSVISLCKLPDVLSRLSQNLDWTQDLGNAFLAQQADVMKAVQKLRNDAYKAGNLKATEQQKVVVQQETIVIQPANPQIVYVPAYDPVMIFGYAPPPAYYYPAMYVPPPGYALARGIMWGAGFAIGNAMFGGCDWGHHDVYINNTVIINNNIYRNTNINTVNRNTNVNNRQTWSHDPRHRGNVTYGNQQLDKKYSRGTQGSLNRDQARGYDRPSQGSSSRGGASNEDRAGGANRGGYGQGAGGARAADRSLTGQGQSSFGGAENGRDAQRASDRGAQSRNRPESGLGRPPGSDKSGGGRKR